MPEPEARDLCQKPSCQLPPVDTYRDANGNKLRLCEKHYYRAVCPGHATTAVSRITNTDEDDDGLFGGILRSDGGTRITAPSGDEMRAGLLPVECDGCGSLFCAEFGPECLDCGHDHSPEREVTD